MFGFSKSKPVVHKSDAEFVEFIEEHSVDLINLVIHQTKFISHSSDKHSFCALPKGLSVCIGCISADIGIFDFMYNGASLFSIDIRLHSISKIGYWKDANIDHGIANLRIFYKEKLTDSVDREMPIVAYRDGIVEFKESVYKKEDIYIAFFKSIKPLIYKVRLKMKELENKKNLAEKERENQRLLRLQRNSEKVDLFIREYESSY